MKKEELNSEMKKLCITTLFVVMFTGLSFGQFALPDQNFQVWGLGGAATGTSLFFPDQKGTVTENFEVLVTGTAPGSLTVNIFGCMRGGTCSTSLASTSGTSSQLIAPSTQALYDKYQGTVSWTGGDATTKITINRSGTVARTGGGGGTITAVTAGTGLTGGGSSGSVTLNLATGYQAAAYSSGTQTITVGPVTLCSQTNCPAGTYLVSVYMNETGTGCTTVGTGKIGVTITAIDNQAASRTVTALGMTSGGTSFLTGMSLTTGGTGWFNAVTIPVNTNGSAVSGTDALQITSTVTACTTPGSWTGYQVRAYVTRVN